MKRVMSATDARVHFGELMRRVTEDRDTVVVERGGAPQVVVLAVDEYERLREAQWGVANMLIDRAHEAIRAEPNARSLPDVVELIRESREERDAQIIDAVLGR